MVSHLKAHGAVSEGEGRGEVARVPFNNGFWNDCAGPPILVPCDPRRNSCDHRML